LDEQQLPLDRLAGGELAHLEDVHELVHLLLDLVERDVGAVDAQRDPRDPGPFGRPDSELVDVVAAPAEQVRHARERARLVFHEDGKRMDHSSAPSSISASPKATWSTAEAPGGIIG